jgi:hypothetical protein
MAPTLEKHSTMRAYLSKDNIYDLQAIRSGSRRHIAAVVGGFIKGEGLEAELLPSGADWMSIRVTLTLIIQCHFLGFPTSPLHHTNTPYQLDPTTGISHLDVRTQARTSTGHYTSVQYTGVLHNDEATAKVFNWAEDAQTTEFGRHQWFAAPKFEASDPELKWIEEAFWVGRGRGVVDEIYRVVN